MDDDYKLDSPSAANNDALVFNAGALFAVLHLDFDVPSAMPMPSSSSTTIPSPPIPAALFFFRFASSRIRFRFSGFEVAMLSITCASIMIGALGL